MIKNLPLALGLFIFGVFLLTAGGHTYSPDEESLVYMTGSFMSRGEWNIPDPSSYPVVGGQRGVGGKTYAGPGLALPLLALPFYTAAEGVATLVDPRFHDFVLRLVLVSLFDPLVTALTTVLLFAWLRSLGASKRAAVALALVYSFATMAAIYARTIYAESLLALFWLLAAYSLYQFHRSRQNRWAIAAGFAAGLAVLAKTQGVLGLPALALYYLALEGPVLYQQWRGKPGEVEWTRLLLPGVLLFLACALVLVVFGYLNWLRFGDPLKNGYGGLDQTSPILAGIYGLLLSSGKSVFLYSPPALLLLFALPGFVRRHAAEALFVLSLIVIVVFFHARIGNWSGDGTWGPRYLVPLLPFLILSLGALATRWWGSPIRRVVLVSLVLLGAVVNVVGGAVNWDAYLQIQRDLHARHFDPPASPLLGNWSLLTDRARAWWAALAGPSDTFLPVRGFLATGEDTFTPRYLAARATVLIRSSLGRPLVLSLRANDYRPEKKVKREMQFVSNGVVLQAQRIPTGDPGIQSYRVQIPAAGSQWAPVDLITVGSESSGASPMGDELGLELQSMTVAADDIEFAQPRYLAIPPLPAADPRAAWAWFFEPANEGFDFATWYLYFSGLDDRTVLVLGATPLLLGLILVLLGVYPVRILLGRREQEAGTRLVTLPAAD